MSNSPLIDKFQDEVNGVIQKYNDQGLTLGEAIGVLEIVKLDMWQAQKEIEYDPYNDLEKNE